MLPAKVIIGVKFFLTEVPMRVLRLIPFLIIAATLTAQHVPSKERGDANYRRQTNIDGNKVRTSIFNYGVTGRPTSGAQYVPYEWPKNSGQHYIAMTQIWVGAEITLDDGHNLQIG
jgi:hypothetical protein